MMVFLSSAHLTDMGLGRASLDIKGFRSFHDGTKVVVYHPGCALVYMEVFRSVRIVGKYYDAPVYCPRNSLEGLAIGGFSSWGGMYRR